MMVRFPDPENPELSANLLAFDSYLAMALFGMFGNPPGNLDSIFNEIDGIPMIGQFTEWRDHIPMNDLVFAMRDDRTYRHVIVFVERALVDKPSRLVMPDNIREVLDFTVLAMDAISVEAYRIAKEHVTRLENGQ